MQRESDEESLERENVESKKYLGNKELAFIQKIDRIREETERKKKIQKRKEKDCNILNKINTLKTSSEDIFSQLRKIREKKQTNFQIEDELKKVYREKNNDSLENGKKTNDTSKLSRDCKEREKDIILVEKNEESDDDDIKKLVGDKEFSKNTKISEQTEYYPVNPIKIDDFNELFLSKQNSSQIVQEKNEVLENPPVNLLSENDCRVLKQSLLKKFTFLEEIFENKSNKENEKVYLSKIRVLENDFKISDLEYIKSIYPKSEYKFFWNYLSYKRDFELFIEFNISYLDPDQKKYLFRKRYEQFKTHLENTFERYIEFSKNNLNAKFDPDFPVLLVDEVCRIKKKPVLKKVR